VLDADTIVYENDKKFRAFHIGGMRWQKRRTRGAKKRRRKSSGQVVTNRPVETFVQYEMKLLSNESGFTPFEALIAATKKALKGKRVFLKTEGTIKLRKKRIALFKLLIPQRELLRI